MPVRKSGDCCGAVESRVVSISGYGRFPDIIVILALEVLSKEMLVKT